MAIFDTLHHARGNQRYMDHPQGVVFYWEVELFDCSYFAFMRKIERFWKRRYFVSDLLLFVTD